jgi:hypothetical protein
VNGLEGMRVPDLVGTAPLVVLFSVAMATPFWLAARPVYGAESDGDTREAGPGLTGGSDSGKFCQVAR